MAVRIYPTLLARRACDQTIRGDILIYLSVFERCFSSCKSLPTLHGCVPVRGIRRQLTIALDGLRSKFLFRVLPEKLSEQHPSVVGSAAATALAPDFVSSYFWISSVRRFASASIASCLLANPTSATKRRSSRVEPRRAEEISPDRRPGGVLALKNRHALTPVAPVGGEVQRPLDHRYVPSSDTRKRGHTCRCLFLRIPG